MMRLSAIVLLHIVVALQAHAQWEPTSGPFIHAGPFEFPRNMDDIVSISSVAGDTILLTATGRGIFYSSNAGDVWTHSDSGLTGTFGTLVNCLAVVGDDVLAGVQGPIYRSSDYGISWNKSSGMYGPETVWDIALIEVPGSTRIIYSAGADGVCRSSNEGYIWQTRWYSPTLPKTPEGYVPAYSLASVPNDSGYTLFAGTYRGVYKSPDEGLTWVSANGNLFVPGWPSEWSVKALGVNSSADGTHYLFASTPSGLYRTSNLGAYWKLVETGLPDSNFTHCIETGVTTEPGILIGTTHSMYWSSDQGENWLDVGVGLPSNLGKRPVHSITISGDIVYAGLGYPLGITDTVIGIWKSSLSAIIRTGIETPGAIPVSASLNSYPNPVASGAPVTLTYTLERAAAVTLKVQDILGRIVYEEALGSLAPGEHTRTLPTSALKPGMYFYTLLPGEGNRMVGKVVVN